MTFTMLIYQGPEAFAARQSLQLREEFWASFTPYMDALRTAGVLRDGAGLEVPEMAKLVRPRDSAGMAQDGPFADTKEQLGGYFIIDVPDLDTALDWAARCPVAAYGAIEVRPNLQMN